MSTSPTPRQTLFLWRLIAEGGGQFSKYMKPAFEKKDHTPLERAGLIESETRKDAQPGKRPARSLFVCLSEKGWEWVAGHMDAEISKSQAAGPVLQFVLTRLGEHLRSQRVSLADFVSQTTAMADRPQPWDDQEVAQLVRAACVKLGDGQRHVRVRLADLRAALGQIPRDRLDPVLLAMEREGAIILYPLDNPQEIRPLDEEAAITNSVGIKRHIVYLED